jgi:hypothetical protein
MKVFHLLIWNAFPNKKKHVGFKKIKIPFGSFLFFFPFSQNLKGVHIAFLKKNPSAYIFFKNYSLSMLQFS